jgi:type VI secretion system secreted protein VgrG
MATTRSGIHAKLDAGGVHYRVLRYMLHEQLSEVSSLSCAIAQDDGEAPDPSALVDQKAVLTLQSNDGKQKRTFAGQIVSAARGEQDRDVQVVEVHVAPHAWRLSKRADCRIFQQQSAKDIVTKVLGDAQVDGDWRTSGSYPPRDYTVQYRETDLAFVSRVLSEEGIYFAVEHKDGKDVVAFGDDPTGFGPVDGTTSLPFRATFGESEVDDYVANVSRVHQTRSDKVTLRDYDANKPKVKLESTKTADGEKGELEVYAYPGRFDSPSRGDALAAVLLDSIRADRDVVEGETPLLTLRPGARFSIEGHPYAPLDGEYLVIALDIAGSDVYAFDARAGEKQRARHSYVCRFRAVPTKTTKYRPPRLARECVVPGLQTAISTGPSGQEIHVDAHARVKAQFHWDRLGKNDDKSSCWMRTSQLPTGGSMLLPRMKWEVAVNYLEGDVDRPVVMARLYNGATMPPYKLPDNKVRSSLQTATTPGGGSTNELRTNDTKGSEEMFFNASKDMSVDVGNNTTESVGNNQTRQIGSNHTLNVTNSFSSSVGSNQSITVAATQDVHVQTFLVDQVGGGHSLTIGAARSMKIGGDHKVEVGGDSKVTVGGPMIDLVVGSANEHVLGNHSHKVAAALVEMTAGSRSVCVAGMRSENAGALKIIGTNAGRGVDVSGTMMEKVGGAIVRSVNGDLAEKAGAGFTEIASGAEILKATNIQIEGETMVTIAMGASTLVLMPAMIVIAGASVKMDGEVDDAGALVMDN